MLPVARCLLPREKSLAVKGGVWRSGGQGEAADLRERRRRGGVRFDVLLPVASCRICGSRIMRGCIGEGEGEDRVGLQGVRFDFCCSFPVVGFAGDEARLGWRLEVKFGG
jgi:hypothetical protein